MKYNAIVGCIGVVGTTISSFFGGWTTAMTTLSILMGIDFITGLIVAGVFHKSTKTKNGSLDSKTGWKGLCRKGVVFLLVLVAHRLDLSLGVSYVKDAVCIAFTVNECISIIENTGLMGVPIPQILSNAIDVLKDKTKRS